jgi:hypothetical protein
MRTVQTAEAEAGILDPMAKTTDPRDVNVRLPRTLVDKAAKLAERVPKGIPQFAGVKLSTVAVLRMALSRGFEAIEGELASTRAAAEKASRR